MKKISIFRKFRIIYSYGFKRESEKKGKDRVARENIL